MSENWPIWNGSDEHYLLAHHFSTRILSIKPASLHFGNAHLLNSKPTKLELSLNGNGIFSITLAKEIDGKSIQQMKS